MLAFDVLWAAGIIDSGTWDTICKFRDASLDKAVNVERDSPNCNCLVAARKLLGEVSCDRGNGCPHVFVSGLKNFNPRSESRSLS